MGSGNNYKENDMNRKQMIVLKDMNSEIEPQLVIFDNIIDMDELDLEVIELRKREGGWTFDDLLDILNKFGGYTMLPLSAIATIWY